LISLLVGRLPNSMVSALLVIWHVLGSYYSSMDIPLGAVRWHRTGPASIRVQECMGWDNEIKQKDSHRVSSTSLTRKPASHRSS
jgi:hypothetical protein